MSAPSRRRRLALNDADARSKASSSAVSIEPRGDGLDILEGQRRGEQNARRRRAARDLPDRQKRFARKSVVRLERSRPPVRHQELAAPSAGDRDPVGIGGGEERADLPSPALAGEGPA